MLGLTLWQIDYSASWRFVGWSFLLVSSQLLENLGVGGFSVIWSNAIRTTDIWLPLKV
jgi:hypothetical protein